MFVCTARFSRKKAAGAVIVLGMIIAAVILLLGRTPPQEENALPQLLTNEDRVEYLTSMGWEIVEEPVETFQFLLPPQLSGDYLAYNELQDAQGFDLSTCCGKQITRYTYTVTNYPQRPDDVQVNLYVCEDLPVAGDIFCAGDDGFQDILVYPQQET